MRKFWNKLFLEERPSISLSFFRIAVALTTGFHVLPTLCHLADNYFPTAFKTYNFNFFTPGIIELVQGSANGIIVLFVLIFCISWFFFLIGLWSQISCIVMTLSCYYFYALNSFHVGTLSWDILLVTLFLMCITPYHGDYFSLDCLRRTDTDSYRKKRSFFVQRLLQLQIGFTYFYTALYKVTAKGNWLTDNPIYYLMNNPSSGVVKLFILKDFLMNKPGLCYFLGVSMLIIEFLMIFLLFYPRTRMTAIYLGIVFHITLILTLDVPAIFFFLFPPQLLLFINPEHVIRWIEQKRLCHKSAHQAQLLYDGKCQFCLRSIQQLQILDLFGTLQMVDFHSVGNLTQMHPQLSEEKALSQLHLVESDGTLYGGFEVFRRICFTMPMLYPLISLLYFPGMGWLGPKLYAFVARNRYLFHRSPTCRTHACFR